MNQSPAYARISLFRALDAPYVVVLFRKPSRVCHLLRWQTETNELESGSWFWGRIYRYKCDLSFDGEWFVYTALGHRAEKWIGVCRPPVLTTVADYPLSDTWGGSGWWGEDLTLVTRWAQPTEGLPIKIVNQRDLSDEEDQRLGERRDRHEWEGVPGTEDPVYRRPDYQLQHPTANYKLYKYWKSERDSSIDRYRLISTELSDPLDEKVDAALLDSLGNLIFSREGVLYRYSPEYLARGEPGAVHDLTHLVPPDGGSK